MCNWAGQFNMTHTLSSHFGKRHFNTALLADNATMLHTFVLATQALVIFHWTKNLGTEKTFALRLKGAVVDCFRLLYFTK